MKELDDALTPIHRMIGAIASSSLGYGITLKRVEKTPWGGVLLALERGNIKAVRGDVGLVITTKPSCYNSLAPAAPLYDILSSYAPAPAPRFAAGSQSIIGEPDNDSFFTSPYLPFHYSELDFALRQRGQI
ncbi:hypothetical protein CCP4SC76_800006 [Gammaproteobacteria bacterium]